MSIKAVNWALNDVKCTPDYKVILIAMGERADDNGLCFPSQAEIAEKTCIPIRTLKRRMQQLRDLDVFETITRQVKTNLRRNTYRLHLESKFNLLDNRPAPSENNGARAAPSSATPKTDNGANVTPLMVPERPHSEQQWCHLDGTYNGATCVAHEPSVNHQYSNSNTSEVTAADVFTTKPDQRVRVTMDQNWRPSAHVFDQLKQHGVPPELAEDWIPEFAMYHGGKHDRQGAFDAKFLKHGIYMLRAGQSQPKPIPEGWEPDQRTIQLLRTEGIDTDFIWTCATEFSMYWSESQIPNHGWQAKFLQHCRQQWSRRSASTDLVAAGAHGALSRMTDRSWAEI